MKGCWQGAVGEHKLTLMLLRNTNASLLGKPLGGAYGISHAEHENLIWVNNIPWLVEIREEELQLVGLLIESQQRGAHGAFTRDCMRQA